jgi:hypothetical protein
VSFIIIIIYLNCKWAFTRWQCTTIRDITQITHHTQTKHRTQNYTNNKGHTTHNEYNANTITTTNTTTVLYFISNVPIILQGHDLDFYTYSGIRNRCLEFYKDFTVRMTGIGRRMAVGLAISVVFDFMCA